MPKVVCLDVKMSKRIFILRNNVWKTIKNVLNVVHVLIGTFNTGLLNVYLMYLVIYIVKL